MTRFEADTSSANRDSAPFLLFLLNHAAEESSQTLIYSIWSQLKLRILFTSISSSWRRFGVLFICLTLDIRCF